VNRWLIWLAVVLAWTVALEVSVPKHEALEQGPAEMSLRKIIAKTAHLSVYAGLTVLSTWPPLPARYRWLMAFFLTAHAWGTEWLQELLHPIFGRGGSLDDVGLDMLGIAFGVALTWKKWTDNSHLS
jgi:hypothetical protein